MGKQVTTQQLVVWVNEHRYPMERVMELSGMSRQGIWKRLKAAQVLIPRRAKGGARGVHVTVNCHFCQTEIRKRVKLASRTLRNFCTAECYHASLETSGYFEWRQGSRLARAIVAQRFPLEQDHIVHHKDGDQRNNDVSNLAVFASQADHLAHHRGRTATALWDGAEK